jgi:hypothetical protein
LTTTQQTSKLAPMKATFQLPDELYREFKVETAREGRTVREVAISLFEQWLREKKQPSPHPTPVDWHAFQPPLASHLPAAAPGHDMESIRKTIARKWNEQP